MALIGTVAAAATETFDINFCPKYLVFTARTNLTLKVTVDGAGILTDLGEDAFIAVQDPLWIGQPSGCAIQLADGLVKNKTTRITVSNTGAGVVSVFGPSTNENATRYIQYYSTQVFTSSGKRFDDFAMLYMPDMDTSDVATVSYTDGLIDEHTVDELLVLSCFNQENQKRAVFNFRQNVKEVNYRPGSDQAVIVCRYVEIASKDALIGND